MGSSKIAVLFLLMALAVFVGAARADDNSVFQKPVRLQADGKDIDTGAALGHSGPCLADFDGDGKRDLIVGDFSGKFHYYKNVGTDKEPKYTDAGYLQAGNEVAKVPIYCCIGSSPQLADFDNDGKVDLISGSYDPGECYLFRGVGPGKFAARETLTDKNGKPILRHPDQQRNVQSFGSWPVLVDWNNDGKADLLIGGFDGTMFVRLNEGTREQPVFSEKNIVVQAGGKSLRLPQLGEMGGHAAVAIADWDQDGKWDILSGCDNGGVYWFRNVGTAGEPRFSDAEVLIRPHEGRGYDEILEVGAEPTPGIRAQVCAVDFNGDGKVDLLVGDFCTTVTPRADLTPDEREKFQAIRAQQKETIAALMERRIEVERKISEKFPGDASEFAEALAESDKAFDAMNESQPVKDGLAKMKELETSIGAYLVRPKRGRFHDYDTAHGHVWLYLRK